MPCMWHRLDGFEKRSIPSSPKSSLHSRASACVRAESGVQHLVIRYGGSLVPLSVGMNASGFLRIATDPFDAMCTCPTSEFKEPHVPIRMTSRGSSTTARVSRRKRSMLANPIKWVTMLTACPFHWPVIVRKPLDDSMDRTPRCPSKGVSNRPNILARPREPHANIL
jgi:hypothetical protein